MTTFALLLALLVLVTAVVAATLRTVRHDGRGTLPPPSSHVVDSRFLPPAAR